MMNSENENMQYSQDTENEIIVDADEVAESETVETALTEEEKVVEENSDEESSLDEASSETMESEQPEDIARNDIKQQDVQKEKEEFISEFAPEPIKIPNYNKEKAMAKHEKKTAKKKKRNSKKSKKRRKFLRKIVRKVRAIMLFVLMLAVLTTTLSVLILKMNTSEYAMHSAIRTHEPERFVIGKIKNPLDMNLKESSSRASVADVLRDNSLLLVTYDDIEQAVSKSSYPDFVADKAHELMQHYLYGTPYKKITQKDLSDLILDNVSYIKLVTGQELGQSACDDIAKNMMKSSALKELGSETVSKQPIAEYTHITSVMLSMIALICMLIALLLLMVLIAVSCNGYAHKMIGWSFIVSGFVICAITIARKLLFEPFFNPAAEFIKSVYSAIASSFVSSALIYGGLTALLGVIILLIGHVMNDEYDDEDVEEDDYIDEIEQVSTAQ